MVKMIDFHLYYGGKIAINASMITEVIPEDKYNFDKNTRISVVGSEDCLVKEGYYEVLDMIQKTNVVWIDAEGKLVEV